MALNRHWGLDALGALGRAVRLAPDLGTALRAIIVNLHLHDRGAVPYLWTDERRAMFGYTLYCSDVVGTDHIYDGALTIAYNVLTELAGPGWRATEVRLFRDPPADTAAFREHFRAPLRFGAQQAAITFPATDLKRPLASADSDRYGAALRHLDAMGAISDNGLADKVRRVLLRLFATGVIGTCAAPDRAMIAQLFALHPRTLNRRLRAEGTTFAAVLAQARYDIARYLLRDTRLPVQDIACILGYAAVGPLIHAFRHWSGTTPSDWRALQG
jgi:AraC-like DNA-binding protein